MLLHYTLFQLSNQCLGLKTVLTLPAGIQDESFNAISQYYIQSKCPVSYSSVKANWNVCFGPVLINSKMYLQQTFLKPSFSQRQETIVCFMQLRNWNKIVAVFPRPVAANLPLSSPSTSPASCVAFYLNVPTKSWSQFGLNITNPDSCSMESWRYHGTWVEIMSL